MKGSMWLLVVLCLGALGCDKAPAEKEVAKEVAVERAVVVEAPLVEQVQTPKAPGRSVTASTSDRAFVLADFDTGDKPSNIGGDFGVWDKDPGDESQSTQMTFVADDAEGYPSGYSIRLDYDVDSPNPAYNGFWMHLNGENATDYNTLNLFVKGDAGAGYTQRFKIELKDMTNKPSAYIVSGVTDRWQKISIPFEKFRDIKNWNALNEFVIVFDDITSDPRTGAILIDSISLSKE